MRGCWLPAPKLLLLPIIQGYERVREGTILLRWSTPQSRTGLWRVLGSLRYYATIGVCTARVTLGDRGGAVSFSTQRATRSLLVVVLPPAACVLLSILGI
jgi:hypothetical protein